MSSIGDERRTDQAIELALITISFQKQMIRAKIQLKAAIFPAHKLLHV